MSKSTTTTGFGHFGLDSLEQLLTVANASIDLYWYNTDRKSLDPFVGLNGIYKGSAIGEPFAFEKADQGNTFLYIIDVEEHSDIDSLCTLSRQARDKGSFTVAIVAAPVHETSYCEGGQLGVVLKNLSKMVDSTIILSNKANSTSPAEAVVAIIKFLSSLFTEKHPNMSALDLEDLKYTLLHTGVVLAGVAEESGTDRAVELIRKATSLPYMPASLKVGSHNMLMSITSGGMPELEMDELEVLTESIQVPLGIKDEIYFGYVLDEALGDRVRMQLIVPVSLDNLCKSN